MNVYFRLSMLSHRLNIRSRYGETDQMGVVHHANYIYYFELARTELIRSIGITYREMEERGILLPVVESHVFHKHPAKYDDELVIHTKIPKYPSVKLEFEYEIYVGDVLICIGQTVLCFTDAQTRKPIRVPAFFEDLISTYYK